MIVLIDNYDSFTYNLLDYLGQIHLKCKVIRNDVVNNQLLEEINPSAIVISPGPKRPAQAGNLMEILHYWHQKCPILGICLGHQAIGEYFQAKLVKALKPMHGKTSWVTFENDPLFKDIPQRFEVMRYHSLVLNNLQPPLKAIAHTAEGEIMALRHVKLPVYGIQFHPESILTPRGLQLLGNWAALVGLIPKSVNTLSQVAPKYTLE